ncbi:MAG: hypothetical protein HY901_02265 [Deltaproteobacteria bacterium]|nr:hypothetical protein [Deltaproteobacteria bacterium]
MSEAGSSPVKKMSVARVIGVGIKSLDQDLEIELVLDALEQRGVQRRCR